MIIYFSWKVVPSESASESATGKTAPEQTIIENLEYFNLKEGIPQVSLNAESMEAQGEELANFKAPKGVYNYQQKKESIRYQGHKGLYQKAKELLSLEGEVKLNSSDSEYLADKVDYFMKEDLIIGNGNVHFTGEDLKTKDLMKVNSDLMHAWSLKKFARFTGRVNGSMTRKKKYEGKTDFKSNQLELDNFKSLAHLEGDVWMKKGEQVVTSGKADIYMENYNKELKYLVLNDDVKVTEKLSTADGIVERKAFAERLEGFGREQKMVLSGAPRVEQGADVVKGYRITIRENADLIEVDDAVSDMKVKKNEKKN